MHYLSYLENNDLIITTMAIKEEILKGLTFNKCFFSGKIMTLKELQDNLVGTYNEEAILYLMRKKDLTYDIAKTKLDNIFYNKDNDLKEELDKEHLLIYNFNFKNKYHKIKIMGDILIDQYTKKLLNDFEVDFIKENRKSYPKKVRKFNSILDEVVDAAVLISEEIKTQDISNIYLVNLSSEYYRVVKRVFKMFNIPVNIPSEAKILGTKKGKNFLDVLKNSKDLDLASSSLDNDEVSQSIRNILNKYAFTKKVDKYLIQAIEKEFKKTKIKINKLKKAVNVISFEEVVNEENKYYHVLGFNEGLVYNPHRDDDYLSDGEKISIGLATSLEYNNFIKEKIKKIILTNKNLTISCKLSSPFNSYYISSLVEELNLPIIEPVYDYTKSNIFNKYVLGIKLDNYFKYHEITDNLIDLYKTYGKDNYGTYNNDFKNISEEKIINYLQDGLTLSYTTLNNYYNCAFKYYISNFLKVDPYEESFAMFIGNLFHYCLAKMYETDFNLDIVYEEYLKKKVLSNKEKFFAQKLKEDLAFVIKTIRYQDTYSQLNNTLTEQKIFVSLDKRVKVTFTGIVDKVCFTNTNDEIVMAIIDYKTGGVTSSLDNINDGLNLQLPAYIYLTSNMGFKNVIVAGFYLQHIIPKVMVDKEDIVKEKRQNLRLSGFSNQNFNYLSLFDNNYNASLVIAGMSTNKDNSFSRYAKVLSNGDIKKIKNIVKNKIEEASENILKGNFTINPKRINGELIGCKYCKYKDICFVKEEDILDIKEQKIEDILKEGD